MILATMSFFFEFLQWLCGCVHVVFNIGEFTEKSPIANISFMPINRLVRYICNILQYSNNNVHVPLPWSNNCIH